MNKFSRKSRLILNTCDPLLQKICEDVLPIMDFSVISGYRGREEQNELFRKGLSTLKFPESYHNVRPSLAVDIAPYPIDWEDKESFYLLAGAMFAVAHYTLPFGSYLRWGGDWDMDFDLHDQTFMDLGHFEIRHRRTA